MATKAPPTLAMLPWWVRDYLASTRGLTLAEKGALTDMLFYEWDMGPLPNDEKRLARMLGVTAEEFAAVWPALKLKFHPNEAGDIVNHRLERERHNSMELRTKASEKAQQAAKARWASAAKSHAPSNAPSMNKGSKGMPEAMLEQCPPSSSPSPSSSAQSASESEEGGSLKKAGRQ